MSPEMGFSSDHVLSESIASVPVPETLACLRTSSLSILLVAASILQWCRTTAKDHSTFHILTETDTGHFCHVLVTSFIGPFHSAQTCFLVFHLQCFPLDCTCPVETVITAASVLFLKCCGLLRLVFRVRKGHTFLWLPSICAQGLLLWGILVLAELCLPHGIVYACSERLSFHHLAPLDWISCPSSCTRKILECSFLTLVSSVGGAAVFLCFWICIGKRHLFSPGKKLLLCFHVSLHMLSQRDA